MAATYEPTPANTIATDDGFADIMENFAKFFPAPPMYAEEVEFGVEPNFQNLVKTLQEVILPTDCAQRMTLKAVVIYHVAEEFEDYEYNVDLLIRAAGAYEMACPTLGAAYIIDFLDLHQLENYYLGGNQGLGD